MGKIFITMKIPIRHVTETSLEYQQKRTPFRTISGHDSQSRISAAVQHRLRRTNRSPLKWCIDPKKKLARFTLTATYDQDFISINGLPEDPWSNDLKTYHRSAQALEIIEWFQAFVALVLRFTRRASEQGDHSCIL